MAEKSLEEAIIDFARNKILGGDKGGYINFDELRNTLEINGHKVIDSDLDRMREVLVASGWKKVLDQDNYNISGTLKDYEERVGKPPYLEFRVRLAEMRIDGLRRERG